MSIRALVVEDSTVARELLTYLLGSDPAIQVVGAVCSGVEAIEAVRRLKPDVITMDINMPGMDGYEATRRIMETHPTPIIVVSAGVDPEEAATTLRALDAGALAAVQKPLGIEHPLHKQTASALIQMVKLMSEVKVVRRWPRIQTKPAREMPLNQPATSIARSCKPLAVDVEIVAIGASTGGPPALRFILSALPTDFPVPILIVQHISPGFIRGLAESLERSCKSPVWVAGDGEALKPGHIYLAPDGMHMRVEKGRRVGLIPGEPKDGVCPSISYLFRSVAEIYGKRAIGVLLTGMGKDGAEGLQIMRSKGAVTIVQDKESSIVHSMPAEAIRLGAALHVLPPDKIAAVLAEMATTVHRSFRESFSWDLFTSEKSPS